MTSLDKDKQLFERLRAFSLFEDVKDEALHWLIDEGDYYRLNEGEMIFETGRPADHMLITLTGGYVIRREKDGRKKEMGLWKAPYVAGVLPFSRMTEAGANGYTTGETDILALHRSCFTEMVNQSYPLTQALVSVMTNRVRDFQQMQLMDEKLMALGKMSAGLAHELNNPASAIVRSSQELHKNLHNTPERFKEVMLIKASPEMVDATNDILFSRIRAGHSCTEELSLMEREERMDDLVDWFDDHEIDNGEDLAETFVDWDFLPEHLDKIAEDLPQESLGAVLWWVETNLNTERLVDEIKEASTRIADLVKAIKSYSHMDQDPSMEFIDVNAGIKSTVTMLYHRIKREGVELKKSLDPDLPYVKALAGELNQVWTNLITNALDAMPDSGGRLLIRSYNKEGCICVEIEDNGSGIPEDKQRRVFEPFFTTKGIGEGTGMGLDIVRRVLDHHNGTVDMESEPGRTVFSVCLPS